MRFQDAAVGPKLNKNYNVACNKCRVGAIYTQNPLGVREAKTFPYHCDY